jgi:hypothetical protein
VIGTEVTLGGRAGRIVALRPGGMADVRFQGSSWIERKSLAALGLARQNPSGGPTLSVRPAPASEATDGSPCGNALDGYAYYLQVPTRARRRQRWITWAEVRQAAGSRHSGLVDFALSTYLPLLAQDPRASVVAIEEPELGEGMRIGTGKYGAKILDPSLVGERKDRKVTGTPPDPKVDFFAHSEGKRVYYRLVDQVDWAQVILERFSPYQGASFALPSPRRLDSDLRGTYGAFVAALVQGSKQVRAYQPGGLDPWVARAFVLGAGVAVQGTLVTDPAFAGFEHGDRVRLSLPAKASSPYFSWVPSVLPTSGGQGACLTSEERATRIRLRLCRSRVSSFGSALTRLRMLLGQWAAAPEDQLTPAEIDKQAHQAISRLSRAYAGVVRWYAQAGEDAANGLPGALAAGSVFLASPLRPGDPSSAFNRALTVFRSTPGVRGLVSGNWIVGQLPPGLAGRKLNATLQRIKRRGLGVQVLDRASGLIRTRTPPKEIQTEQDYAEFRQGLLAWISGATKAIPLHLPAKMLGASVESSGKLATVAPRSPGASAAQFYAGPETPVHPLDSLLPSFWASLGPAQKRDLQGFREALPAAGLHWLRHKLPAQLSREQRTRGLAQFRNAQVPGGTPLLAYESLVKKYALASSLSAAQRDENWGVLLSLWLYEALVWVKGETPDRAAATAANVLVAAQLYALLGGYVLTGPSNPHTPVTAPALLPTTRKYLAQHAGPSSSARVSGVATFVTYNPVLVETTRLGLGRQAPWEGFHHHPQLLQGLDTVGTYGMMAALTEAAARQGEDQEGTARVLLSWLSPVLSLTLGEWSAAYRQAARSGLPPKGVQTFWSTWRLGLNATAAGNVVNKWLEDPLGFLGSKKRKATGILAQLIGFQGRWGAESIPLAPGESVPRDSYLRKV